MGPPPLQTGTVVNQTYRFRSASSGSQTITVAQLLRACGHVAPSTGTAGTVGLIPIAASLRVKRLRLWNSMNFTGSTTPASANIASVSVDFDVDALNGGNPGLQFTDSTNSPSRPAFIDVVPPPGSLASFWHSQVESAIGLFALNCGLGAFIDVHVEWVLNDDDGIAGISTAANLVTVTTGHMYYPGLGPNRTEYPPIGRTTA